MDILFERVLVHRACQAFGNFALPYTFAALPLHNIVGQFLLGHYLIFIRNTDSGYIIGEVRCIVPFKADMDTILIINMDYYDFRVNSRLDVVCNLLTDIPQGLFGNLLPNRRPIWFYPEIEFAFLVFVQDGSN